MPDQDTSGGPNQAPETAAGSANSAAPSGEPKPIGTFGNARGSGLSRGKRTSTAAAAPSAPSASVSSYKPTSVEVITPRREYTHPFASETPATAIVNEPSREAAPQVSEAPVTAHVSPEAPGSKSAAPASEMFPFAPPDANEPKPGSPQPQPEASNEKAEIKILPPAEAKRPAVSWGDTTHDEDTRPQPEQRPSFHPDRREPRSFEPREPKPFQPREPRREREPFQGQRAQQPRDDREAPSAKPAAKSGGFFGWLKGLFSGKSATPAATQPDMREDRDGRYREGEYRGQRRRHRGGRGRGGYQGENRGPRDGQFRDQQSQQPGSGQDHPNDQYGQQDERRFEGGGRRRRRGGRGRYRDDRGGPQSEGQQGGGAI